MTTGRGRISKLDKVIAGPWVYCLIMLVLLQTCPALGQVKTATDAEVAASFAPVFYQALGDKPRSDYITNFDFDGDWRGDNNWDNAEKKEFPLRAYIYYSVSETRTHYFIQYAVFHPRDYKGGEEKGRLLSKILQEGARAIGTRDPTGMLDEAVLAHENDMEGCLVVVAKSGKNLREASVAYVESLHHNTFSDYMSGESAPQRFKTEDARPLLYVEAKGHGIEAYTGDAKQAESKEFLIYRYTGKADDPEQQKSGAIGYELLPIKTTLWPKARIGTKPTGTTFGAAHDYSLISIDLEQANGKASAKKFNVGGLGSAFLGKAGGVNMARPPWGWFDNNHRSDPLGLWFFDPARIVRRDFNLGESFSTAYIRLPFWATK